MKVIPEGILEPLPPPLGTDHHKIQKWNANSRFRRSPLIGFGGVAVTADTSAVRRPGGGLIGLEGDSKVH